jgi:hypothetical protein
MNTTVSPIKQFRVLGLHFLVTTLRVVMPPGRSASRDLNYYCHPAGEGGLPTAVTQVDTGRGASRRH